MLHVTYEQRPVSPKLEGRPLLTEHSSEPPRHPLGSLRNPVHKEVHTARFPSPVHRYRAGLFDGEVTLKLRTRLSVWFLVPVLRKDTSTVTPRSPRRTTLDLSGPRTELLVPTFVIVDL